MTYTYFRVIRLADTDAAGVIYFSNLLAICHEAYEDYLTSSGIMFQHLVYHGTIALPIVHGEIDFYKPIKCGDRILIEVTPQIIKSNKFEIGYRVIKELETDLTLAIAKTRHVCIDKKTRQRVDFPDIIRKSLEN